MLWGQKMIVSKIESGKQLGVEVRVQKIISIIGIHMLYKNTIMCIMFMNARLVKKICV